jgi:dihydropteroate synthase
VVAHLAAAGAVVSIDTMRASTAVAALAAGATIVNDVSGGQSDADLPKLVAESGVPYVVMHWRAHSDRMQQHADYRDVVCEVRDELLRRLDDVAAAGVTPEQTILDPGLGFAKRGEHNWALLAHLDVLTALGRPLLVGASRKSFLGELLGGAESRPVTDRDDATAALTVVAATAGAWAVRVHSVRPSADAVRVVARLAQEGNVR